MLKAVQHERLDRLPTASMEVLSIQGQLDLEDLPALNRSGSSGARDGHAAVKIVELHSLVTRGPLSEVHQRHRRRLELRGHALRDEGESSKRPAMAFLTFTARVRDDEG